MRPSARTTAGFTLIELAVTLLLVALLLSNLFTVITSSSGAMGTRTANVHAEVQARRVLDRIALAVIGSSEEKLYITTESPSSQPELNYQLNLGLDDPDGDGIGEAVWSDPQRIARTEELGGEVAWLENPGQPNQKRVVWTKSVPKFGLGEIDNGLDDNGNGLIDETGLAFIKEGNSIRIRLTLRAPDGSGGFVDRELEAVVACRN